MRISIDQSYQKTSGGTAGSKRNQSGSATVVFIALLAIMLILVTVNSRALFRLHREVKFMEQQQIQRLNASQTNVVASTQPESK